MIDPVVRLVLSHMMEPSATPAKTADDIAWIAARVLAADEWLRADRRAVSLSSVDAGGGAMRTRAAARR